MRLHLAGPADGALLAVCDQLCAMPARSLLGPMVRTTTDGWPELRTECVHCAWCSALLHTPVRCAWHPNGCPSMSWSSTVLATAICAELARVDGFTLTDRALGVIEGFMADAMRTGSLIDPAAIVARVRRARRATGQ